ncbi:MAG: hypothetical protein RLZZ502_279 [Pseudomonadota bacterium]
MSARALSVPNHPLPLAVNPTKSNKNEDIKDSAGTVQSLTRGLHILEKIAAHEGGLNLTDISIKTGLAASTTHRLLATLERLGYVTQDKDMGLWYIGLKTYQVGSAFISHRDLVGESHHYLRRLMEAAGETANLAILDDTVAVFIAQVQCHEVMRMTVRLGSRLSIHASGSGKAILAALPDEELERLLAHTDMTALTPKTITNEKVLREQLTRIRQLGYSYDDEEVALGLRCVAAPVYDEFSEPLGAISLAGPLTRMNDSRIVSLGQMVANTAREITLQIGGRLPKIPT